MLYARIVANFDENNAKKDLGWIIGHWALVGHKP